MVVGFVDLGIRINQLLNLFTKLLMLIIHYVSGVIFVIWYLEIVIFQQFKKCKFDLTLPEEYIANLNEYETRLKKQALSEKKIKRKIFWCLIESYLAHIQCQIENIWLNKSRIE